MAVCIRAERAAARRAAQGEDCRLRERVASLGARLEALHCPAFVSIM